MTARLAPRAALGQVKARVVVVGGGVAGATVAKYVAKSSDAIEVTLVEPKERYTTCFFSNLYLAGLRSLESISHGYETLFERYGIKVVRDSATGIDPVAKTVSVKGGAVLPYDRLVVAPGIAEALLATGLGLFAAIPSVIFYNYFQTRISAYGSRTEGFIAELTNAISRQLDKGA